MDEQMMQQIQQLVMAAMQGDQQAIQQVQQIMQAAQQGDQQAAQLAQIIQQVAQQIQGQQAQAARFGAKLNYIKHLRGECPMGYEMQMFKKGGRLCKTCVKKNQPGGNIETSNNENPIDAYKNGCKTKKPQKAAYGTKTKPMLQKCGGKSKKLKKYANPDGPLPKENKNNYGKYGASRFDYPYKNYDQNVLAKINKAKRRGYSRKEDAPKNRIEAEEYFRILNNENDLPISRVHVAFFDDGSGATPQYVKDLGIEPQEFHYPGYRVEDITTPRKRAYLDGDSDIEIHSTRPDGILYEERPYKSYYRHIEVDPYDNREDTVYRVIDPYTDNVNVFYNNLYNRTPGYHEVKGIVEPIIEKAQEINPNIGRKYHSIYDK